MATASESINSQINPLEKRVVFGAIIFMMACLGLIAYATWGLGINAPTCVPDSKGFDTKACIPNARTRCVQRNLIGLTAANFSVSMPTPRRKEIAKTE